MRPGNTEKELIFTVQLSLGFENNGEMKGPAWPRCVRTSQCGGKYKELKVGVMLRWPQDKRENLAGLTFRV